MSEPAKSIENLHPETLQASKTRSLNGAFDGKRLLKILGELAKLDETLGASMSALNKSGAKYGVATFLILFGGAFFTAFTGLWMVLLLAPVTGAICAVKLVRAHRMKKRDDLLDDFRVLARPILREVLADLDPEKKVKVRMDLTGMADSKKSAERQLPPGRFQKLTETIQNDPWCELRLPLADGSTAILELVNEYHKLERRYRGRSGKIKWKSKWRKDLCVIATVLPPAGIGWNESAEISQLLDKVKAFEKDGVTGKSVKRWWSFKGTNEDVAGMCPQPREIVGMLLRLHNGLAVSAGGKA